MTTTFATEFIRNKIEIKLQISIKRNKIEALK